jgi:hypothetical protein
VWSSGLGEPESGGRRRTVGRREGMAGGECRRRRARGRKRAGAPAGKIEARRPEMAGAAVESARLGLRTTKKEGRGSKQNWERIRPRWS